MTSEKVRNVLRQKKYQVEIEINGKKKFAYVDDLEYLDRMMKATRGRIIEIIELKKEEHK